MNFPSKHKIRSTGAKQTAHLVPANKYTSSGQQAPFVIRNKTIQVTGLSPSACKETISEGSLVDRRQKFLENVADIILDLPGINIAVGKALGALGNTPSNVKPSPRKRFHAEDNAWVDVSIRLAFVSPPRSSLSHVGTTGQVSSKGKVLVHGGSSASTVPHRKGIPRHEQDIRDTPQMSACCESQPMDEDDTATFQLLPRTSSMPAPCPHHEEREAVEHGLGKSHSKAASSAHSSCVPLQKCSTVPSGSSSSSYLFSKSLKKHSLTARKVAGVWSLLSKSSSSVKASASEQKVREITITLGAEVVRRITEDKAEIRSLVRHLSRLGARYRWRRPNRIVVTATTTSLPHDWEERVERLMRKKEKRLSEDQPRLSFIS